MLGVVIYLFSTLEWNIIFYPKGMAGCNVGLFTLMYKFNVRHW